MKKKINKKRNIFVARNNSGKNLCVHKLPSRQQSPEKPHFITRKSEQKDQNFGANSRTRINKDTTFSPEGNEVSCPKARILAEVAENVRSGLETKTQRNTTHHSQFSSHQTSIFLLPNPYYFPEKITNKMNGKRKKNTHSKKSKKMKSFLILTATQFSSSFHLSLSQILSDFHPPKPSENHSKLLLKPPALISLTPLATGRAGTVLILPDIAGRMSYLKTCSFYL